MTQDRWYHKLRPLYKQAYPRMMRLVRVARGLLEVAGNQLLGPASGRRLLMAYDLGTQPISIGDMLVIHEASLVLRKWHGLNLVDVALILPEGEGNDRSDFSIVSRDTAFLHIPPIIQVAQLNPHLGSLFRFNSRAQFENYVRDNWPDYHVWPSLNAYASKDYLLGAIYKEILHREFLRQGSLPPLTLPGPLVQWADSFFRKHVFPAIPVTVGYRNNPHINPQRNLEPEVWKDLFSFCAQQSLPIKFIIVCARHETAEWMRQLPNIMVAKDHDTVLEQDLALVHGAAIHTGAASGASTLAEFSNKPYFCVTMCDRAEVGLERRHGDVVVTPFATDLQSVLIGRPTTDRLRGRFLELWQSIDHEGWYESHASVGDAVDLKMWLR